MTAYAPDDGSLDLQGPLEAPGAAARSALLAAATRARAPRTSLLRAERLHPGEAHRRQWEELAELLAELSPADWSAVTSMDVTVHELVAHLVAQHRWIARSLFHAGHFVAPPGTEHDHWALSWPTIERLRTQPVADAVAELAAACALVIDVATAMAEDGWSAGTLPLSDVFAARTFELWIHTDDIRRSTGRPLRDPDAPRLDRLCRLAASFTPLGMAIAGRTHDGKTMRLVLTSSGGGTWVQPLGISGPPSEQAGAGADADADVTIVADGARFCRVAGKLFGLHELDAEVEGDAALVDDVLAGVRAFAE